MGDRRSQNVMHYLQAIHQRQDLTENLKQLKCRTLILVGDQSPFHHEALHINNAMNRRYNALIEVRTKHLHHPFFFCLIRLFSLCVITVHLTLLGTFFPAG